MQLYQIVADMAGGTGKVVLFVVAGSDETAIRIAAAHDDGRFRHPTIVGSADAASDLPPRVIALRTPGPNEPF